MKIQNPKLLNIISLGLEVIPILCFFLGNLYNIFLATALLMIGSIVSVIIFYKLNKKIPKLTLALSFLALIFGALTLIFHNEDIIKIKVTVLDIFLSIIFFSAAFWKKNIIHGFTPKIARHPSTFVIINNLWGVFFLGVAILNEFVWRNFSTKDWVYFKVFGIFSLVVIFALLQLVVILVIALIKEKGLLKKNKYPQRKKKTTIFRR